MTGANTKQFLITLAAGVAAALVVDWIRRRRTRASVSVINGGQAAY